MIPEYAINVNQLPELVRVIAFILIAMLGVFFAWIALRWG